MKPPAFVAPVPAQGPTSGVDAYLQSMVSAGAAQKPAPPIKPPAATPRTQTQAPVKGVAVPRSTPPWSPQAQSGQPKPVQNNSISKTSGSRDMLFSTSASGGPVYSSDGGSNPTEEFDWLPAKPDEESPVPPRRANSLYFQLPDATTENSPQVEREGLYFLVPRGAERPPANFGTPDRDRNPVYFVRPGGGGHGPLIPTPMPDLESLYFLTPGATEPAPHKPPDPIVAPEDPDEEEQRGWLENAIRGVGQGALTLLNGVGLGFVDEVAGLVAGVFGPLFSPESGEKIRENVTDGLRDFERDFLNNNPLVANILSATGEFIGEVAPWGRVSRPFRGAAREIAEDLRDELRDEFIYGMGEANADTFQEFVDAAVDTAQDFPKVLAAGGIRNAVRYGVTPRHNWAPGSDGPSYIGGSRSAAGEDYILQENIENGIDPLFGPFDFSAPQQAPGFGGSGSSGSASGGGGGPGGSGGGPGGGGGGSPYGGEADDGNDTEDESDGGGGLPGWPGYTPEVPDPDSDWAFTRNIADDRPLLTPEVFPPGVLGEVLMEYNGRDNLHSRGLFSDALYDSGAAIPPELEHQLSMAMFDTHGEPFLIDRLINRVGALAASRTGAEAAALRDVQDALIEGLDLMTDGFYRDARNAAGLH